MPDVETMRPKLRGVSVRHSGGYFLNRFTIFNPFAQLFEGNILKLADSLTSNTKLLSHFLERLFAPAVKAEAVAQDGGFARIQGLHHFADQIRVRFVLKLL